MLITIDLDKWPDLKMILHLVYVQTNPKAMLN